MSLVPEDAIDIPGWEGLYKITPEAIQYHGEVANTTLLKTADMLERNKTCH